MIFSADRRISSPTNNYREWLDPETGLVHVSIDFYIFTKTTTIQNWILYHDTPKNLYRLKLESVADGEDPASGIYYNWVRLTAIVDNGEKSADAIRRLEEEKARLVDERRKADEARHFAELEAERLRREGELIEAHAREMRQQARNDTAAGNIERGNVSTEAPKKSMEEAKDVAPKRDFSNLIMDE